MNEKLEKLLNINPDEAGEGDDKALLEEIRNASLIMPVEISSESGEEFAFRPVKISDDDGNLFIPLFTNDNEVYGHTSAVDISSRDLADMIDDNPENINGVVINPFSKFSLELEMDSFLKIFKS